MTPSKPAVAHDRSGDAGNGLPRDFDAGTNISAGASASARRRFQAVLVWGGLAFALLTLRFSPNWITFHAGLRDAKSSLSSAAETRAIDREILSGYSARGFYVTQQARDLNARIDDPNHQIVRWRLLFPLVGFLLRLPGWSVLGLAHVGCAVLILAWVALGLRLNAPAGSRAYEAGCFAVIAGASAPFFSSMGLLGYYDAWLGLALLTVSTAQTRWVVVLAAVLAPWIDERFVLGLPLALAVRFLLSDSEPAARWQWLKLQALAPLGAVVAFSLFRLALGGSGGSQTVGEYLDQFVFANDITLGQRLRGAWEGLRFGWVLVAMAIVGTWRVGAAGRRIEAAALVVAIGFTALLGLFTALDLGRSMVLLISVLPLGWKLAARRPWWRTFQLAPWLAAAALILPAGHVVGKFVRPVDSVWTAPLPLITAQNNLAVLYARGIAVPADIPKAITWYRKAAEHGSAIAQYNLAVIYATGENKDTAEAIKWYRRAAEQGIADAYYSLGVLYANGDGLTRDLVQAHGHWTAAMLLGNATAKESLAAIEKYMKPAEIAAAKELARERANTGPGK